MPLELTAPPATEPVSLADAKAYLKVDTTDDDALITRLISAARARAEWHTGRAFVTQNWTLWLDGWPDSGVIEIPLPPLQSVTSLTTWAPDDTATVMDASLYQVDTASSPARLVLKPATASPANLRAANAHRDQFHRWLHRRSSTALRSRPRTLRALYESRGVAGEELPLDALALLAPYRIFKLLT